jgi:NitT/TauT family transport system substrate-binding protein
MIFSLRGLFVASLLMLVACSSAAPEASRSAPAPAGAPSAPSTSVAPAASAPTAITGRAPLDPPVKVRVGYSPSSGTLPLYVAVEKGYFQAEGLEIELIPFTLNTDQFPALASDQIDVGGSGADTVLFNAIARGIDMKVVAYFAAAHPAHKGLAILVRKDHVDSGRYKEPRDLKGMTIAVLNPASSIAMYLEMGLAKAGLSLDDIELLSLPYPDMNAAMANKRIDGAVNVQPYILQAESQGLAQTVFTAGEVAAGFPSTLVVMASNFTRSQPEAARRYVLGFLRGQRDVYLAFDRDAGNPDEMYEFLAKYTAFKDPKQNEALASTGVFGGMMINGGIPREPLDYTQDFFIRMGAQQERVDLTRVVDTTYVDYAVQQLGRLPTD